MEQTPAQFFAQALEYSDPHSCLDWPFTNRRGYGLIWWNNRLQSVPRLICTTLYGKPRGRRTHAAHRCNRRTCVNPHHLRWATPLENAADRTGRLSLPHPHARVIERLGGIQRVASLLETSYQAAYKWSMRGIPAKHWHRITALNPTLTAEFLERTKHNGKR